MSGDRQKRLLKILELVTTRSLHTQEELAEALAEAGWEVTQSSVSRDIAALRLIKVDGVYRRPPAEGLATQNADERRFAESVIGVTPAGDALVVVHTPSGDANHAAAAMDRLAWAEVIGTLAGDNTIFVAVAGRAAQRRVVQRIRALIGE